MKAFFEAIQSLFVDFLFLPFDGFRALELKNWWFANIINWIFVGICVYYLVYWCKQINLFNEDPAEKQDTSAHSIFDS